MSKIWFVLMLSAAMGGCAAPQALEQTSFLTCGMTSQPLMRPLRAGSVTMHAIGARSSERLRIRGDMIALTREGKLTLALALGLNEIARLETQPEARSELAGVLVEVGQLQQALGRVRLAQASYLRAIALYADGPFEQPETLVPTTGLAILYRREGKLAEALRLQRDAYPKLLEWLGPAHPDVIESHGELARLHLALKHYDKAAALFRTSLKRARVARDRSAMIESRHALSIIRRAILNGQRRAHTLGGSVSRA